MSQTSPVEFTTVSVYPQIRDNLREARDEAGFRGYSGFFEAMLEQFDPDECGTN